LSSGRAASSSRKAFDSRGVGEAVQPFGAGAQLGGVCGPRSTSVASSATDCDGTAERAAEVVLIASDARAARLERERERLERVDGELHLAVARRDHRIARVFWLQPSVSALSESG
jgi:hypothetical protein